MYDCYKNLSLYWPLTELWFEEWNICPTDLSVQEMSQSHAASCSYGQDHSRFPLTWMSIVFDVFIYCLANGHSEHAFWEDSHVRSDGGWESSTSK